MNIIFKIVAIVIVCTCASFSYATGSAGLAPAKINPQKLGLNSYECSVTNEVTYSVSLVSYTSAYPQCPPDTYIDKVNLRTKRYGANVYTYISLNCCKQKLAWPQDKTKA